MKYAKIKYNSGIGALLCNECSVIIAVGFDHEDKEHYCTKCETYDTIAISDDEGVLLTIPDKLLEKLAWSIGTMLTVEVVDGSIVLREVDKTESF